MATATLTDLFADIIQQPAFQQLLREMQAHPQAEHSLSGLTLTAKALYLVLLQREIARPLVVVVDGNKEAEALAELVDSFHDLAGHSPEASRPQLIPQLDVMPFQHLSPHSEISEQRAIGMWRLATQPVPMTITPIGSALLKTESAEFYRQLALTLRRGDEIALEDLTQHLESIGYTRQEPVELVGEYSVRGGILDVFSAEAEQPLRVEFFGDEIDSLRYFDPETQRSTRKVQEATLLPLLEYPKSRQLFRELAECAAPDSTIEGEPFPGWEFLVPAIRPRSGSLFDLSPDAMVVWDEPELVNSAAERFWTRLESSEQSSPCPTEKVFFTAAELKERVADRTRVAVRELELLAAGGQAGLYLPTRPSSVFHGNVQAAVNETRQLVSKGQRVLFFGLAVGELERLADIFQEYSIPFQLLVDEPAKLPPNLKSHAGRVGEASTLLVQGCVRKGVVMTGLGLTLFGAEDLYETSDLVATPHRTPKTSITAFQSDLADLRPGDFVVHATHGVGKFLGIKTLPQGESTADFLLLEYAGESKLYVPLTRLDLVQKFRGAEQTKPQLDRMGGVTWEKTKSRIKAKMRDMADELLKLYAQRKMAPGFAFSADSNWQREFEDAFEYPPTKDQVQAVKEIKRDMESPHPMDRLLCGDVGFGKTEVAMRAAFKALGDGKQVAVLAPTTVLALQHFESFRRRFASFPVKIEMLSRFRSPKELKQAIAELGDGRVDVVIGTHRILSQDVEYKDLGLLVVDEEQRFGVRHKERLKHIKKNVDVLTMSATPIPRTLHMSLLGMRDMSVIETPPKDRLSIHTVVAHYNPDLIKTAIEQELSRGGQVYFVHNRVDTIFMRAASIQEMLPHIRIGVGHGQMAEAELEKVLLGFMKHEFDVFVCTTIVENGLDIPLANTILIENAERYGLSELYQLRGRVGRSNRRAYSYLLVPVDRELSEIARKRLAALKEFSDLGAGFKIAALDLELRGAGNLLGGEQHGHIGTIGFDTYIKLLEETVQELRGEAVVPEIHSTINLGLDVRIPPDYIGDEHQRLRAYKRIADAADQQQGERVLAELEDRYGPVPDAMRILFQFTQVKNLAQRVGVEAVDRRQGFFNIKFHPDAKVEPSRLMALVQRTPGAQFTPAGVLRLPVPSPAPQALLQSLADSLQAAVVQ